MINFLGDEDEDENAKKQEGEQKQKPCAPHTCVVHFLAVAALFTPQPLSRLKFLKVACLQA